MSLSRPSASELGIVYALFTYGAPAPAPSAS